MSELESTKLDKDRKYNHPLSIILVAAGLSSRMGSENKLLLPYQGKSILEKVLDTLCCLSVVEIIVVTGHQKEDIEKITKSYTIHKVFNPLYKSGLTSSIQTGIRIASTSSMGYMVCLADMPLIREGEYEKILTAFQRGMSDPSPQIILPRHQGKWGHPRIFSYHFKTDILTHNNPDSCRDIILTNPSYHQYVDMSTDHILLDIDAPQSYEAMLKR